MTQGKTNPFFTGAKVCLAMFSQRVHLVPPLEFTTLAGVVADIMNVSLAKKALVGFANVI